MGITNNNIPQVDIPRWEATETMLPWNTSSAMATSYHVKQLVFIRSQSGDNNSNGGWFMYDPQVDGVVGYGSISNAISVSPLSLVANTWSTGTTIAASSLTATSGTTSTITTNQTLAINLKGWPIHILEGPNAGVTLTITSNTVGANSVITVPTQASAFSNATKYRLLTPRWYGHGSSTFRVFDYATQSWTSLANSPVAFTSVSVLTATPSWRDNDYLSFATGTATSATSTTLVNTAKSWTTNQWVNYQIRIVSGTGAGQIRTITANDATSVTVSTWTTTPDNTSTYSIEGNDDFIYLAGNQAVTLYRYSISGNTWTTLSPAVARTGTVGDGSSMFWPCEVSDSSWTNENSIINGRRLYSHRGGLSSTAIDYYDIPSNSWTVLSYSPPTISTNTAGGNRWCFAKDRVYWNASFGNYGASTYVLNRWAVLNLVTQEVEAFPNAPRYSESAFNNSANLAFDSYYRNGNDYIRYIYTVTSTNLNPVTATIVRCMVPKGYS